jgi:glutamate 5-kinase
MSDVRQQYLSHVRNVVIKLGSQLLTDKDGRLDSAFIAQIAKQIAELRQKKLLVTVVSSGAIAAGMRELNIAKRPTDLARLQAIAAVGQRRLMDVWAAALTPVNLSVAQLLITREDIDDRTRFLNVRNTIHAAHELGAVPIINENDTISTDEIVRITFGDNDILAALVAHAMRADLLVLLSNVDGLLDSGGQSIRIVEKLDDVRRHVRADRSASGKGGMNSKLEAARMVTDAGEAMVIAAGRIENVLPRILAGDEVGTLFVSAAKKRSSRSRWIGSVRTAGSIFIDDGAVKAVVEKNKSLLAAGIVKVAGPFDRGDVVAICALDGRIIARGLCNFASKDIETIRGKKSSEIRNILGDVAYDEVVHKDNLVIG